MTREPDITRVCRSVSPCVCAGIPPSSQYVARAENPIWQTSNAVVERFGSASGNKRGRFGPYEGSAASPRRDACYFQPILKDRVRESRSQRKIYFSPSSFIVSFHSDYFRRRADRVVQRSGKKYARLHVSRINFSPAFLGVFLFSIYWLSERTSPCVTIPRYFLSHIIPRKSMCHLG